MWGSWALSGSMSTRDILAAVQILGAFWMVDVVDVGWGMTVVVAGSGRRVA